MAEHQLRAIILAIVIPEVLAACSSLAPDPGHQTPLFLILALICGVGIVLMGFLWLWQKVLPRQPRPDQSVTEGLLRSELARTVTIGSLVFVVITASIILLCAGINAATPPFDKDKTNLFFDIAKYVLGAILPVVGVWVGTVLAFYFGKENFEAATRSVTAAARALSSRDKLEATSVQDLGKAIQATAHLTLGPAETADTITLDKIEKAFIEGQKVYERLPVLLSSSAPYMVLHRSTLNDFLLQKKKAEKDKESKDYKLTDLFAEKPWLPDKSFVTVGPSATAAQARAEMDKIKDCSDVFVTADGTRQGAVSRWITNVDLLEAAQV